MTGEVYAMQIRTSDNPAIYHVACFSTLVADLTFKAVVLAHAGKFQCPAQVLNVKNGIGL